MSNTKTLLDRNRHFAESFASGDLPPLPKLRAVILACADARVDPAHVLGLELGDAVVIRNTGARVTPEVLQEVASLAFLAAKMDGPTPGPFELVILQHSECGAERFADPTLQQALREQLGVDVSAVAISDHEQSLRDDVEYLRRASEVPAYVVVSGFMYDVREGSVREVIAPAPLRSSEG